MTVRATERPNQLINDLITLRDAERVICRMSREEIMTRMKLGLFDGNSDQYYVADYEDTLEEHSHYAEILLGVRPCEEGVELVPESEGLEGVRLRIYAAPRHPGKRARNDGLHRARKALRTRLRLGGSDLAGLDTDYARRDPLDAGQAAGRPGGAV